MNMTTRQLSDEEFDALEGDLCDMHKFENEEERITDEWESLIRKFGESFPQMRKNIDYETTEWHHNIRMLWVYLYSPDFYEPRFSDKMHLMLAAMPQPWFAQFECYSGITPAGEAVGERYSGQIIIYQDSVIGDARSAESGLMSSMKQNQGA